MANHLIKNENLLDFVSSDSDYYGVHNTITHMLKEEVAYKHPEKYETYGYLWTYKKWLTNSQVNQLINREFNGYILLAVNFIQHPVLQQALNPTNEISIDGPIFDNAARIMTETHQNGYAQFVFVDKEDTAHVVYAGGYSVYWGGTVSNPMVVALPKIAELLIAVREFTIAVDQLVFNAIFKDMVKVLYSPTPAYKPMTNWDKVILEPKLKKQIQGDIEGFFTHGVEKSQEMGLHPFRKILLSGPPGTGKTSIGNAAAKWCLDQGYRVYSVSAASADKNTFLKIVEAINATYVDGVPSLILVEDFDAYLTNPNETPMILNALDGNDISINPKGVMLIMTTNHPDRIEGRILNRPGRVDRIFHIPEIGNKDIALMTLQLYFGPDWHDDLVPFAKKVVGLPAVFVKELALYTRYRLADSEEKKKLTVKMLQSSLDALQVQRKYTEDYVEQQTKKGNNLGFSNSNSDDDPYWGGLDRDEL